VVADAVVGQFDGRQLLFFARGILTADEYLASERPILRQVIRRPLQASLGGRACITPAHARSSAVFKDTGEIAMSVTGGYAPSCELCGAAALFVDRNRILNHGAAGWLLTTVATLPGSWSCCCCRLSSCEEVAGAAFAVGQASAVRGAVLTRVKLPRRRRRS
jgi:hypothetical protein